MNKAELVVVLDRSGSMQVVKSDTIGGFNAFLDGQKADPIPTTMTLVQFDTEYEFVHKGVPVKDVPALTENTFVPRGGTALLDAMGRAIVETGERLKAMPEADRPTKVIFVVITDGQENSSVEYTKAKIQEMIKRQQEVYSWLFVFLGTTEAAISDARDYGVGAGNAMRYANSAAGIRGSYAAMGQNVTLNKGSSVVMDFTAEDRKQAEGK